MDDIALVRLYIDDPDDGQPVFDDDTIQAFLDSTGDAHGAASEIWAIKAANVSDWYAVQLDGGLLTRQQVFDHCLRMSEYHSGLSTSSLELTSALMDGGSGGSSDTSSEF